MMKPLRRPSALLAAFASLLITAASHAKAEVVVLKNATVIDVVADKAVPNAVVVIEDDRIKTVGGRATAIPVGAQVIDLTGKYLIPGLMDGHSHYRPYLGEMYLNNGVTSILYMGGFNLADQYRLDTQGASFRAPRLFGPGSAPLPRRNDMTREEVRAAVQAFAKGGGDFANLEDYNARNKKVWQWKAEDLRAAGIMVYGHTSNAAESIPLGHDVIEHVWGLSQAMMTPEEYENYRRGKYVHWGTFLKDEAKVDRLIQEAVKRDVYLNPTMVYSYSSLSAHAAQYEQLMRRLYEDSALMTYYPQNLADGMLLRMRGAWVASRKYANYVPLSRMTPAELAEFKEGRRLADRTVKKWVQAGGKLVAGTDDPFIGTPGLSAHLEMAMLVEAGLTPMQALKSMTIWTAQVMTARRLTPTKPPVGYIGEGAFADIVVLGADPLADIDNTLKIERVMKGGRFVKLGYTASYSQAPPDVIRVVPTNPDPEISAIAPHTVKEAGPAFEMTVEGNGFNTESIVRVDDITVETTYVSSRQLKAKIPARVIAAGQPNRFRGPGLDQYLGVDGDHSAKITVFNHPPDGGTSNSVFLRVQEPWLSESER